MPHSLASRVPRNINRPGTFPPRIRNFLSCVWVASFLGIGLFRPGFTRGLTYLGLLLGICGAAVLYWETSLAPDEATLLANGIEAAGRTPNLAKSDWEAILIASFFSVLSGAVICFAAWNIDQHSPNPYRLAWQLLGGVAYAVVPPCSLAYTFRGARRWLHKQIFLLREQSHDAMAKQYFRKIGFVLLVLSGVFQIPDILWVP